MAKPEKMKLASYIPSSPLPAAQSVSALSGCCCAVSGTFPGQSQASVFAYAQELGATTSKTISAHVTHLITSQKDCDKPSTKVNQANDLGISLVSLDWIVESELCGTKQPEKDFALTAADYKAVPAAAAVPNNNKRQASLSPGPEPKKTKLGAVSGKTQAIGKSQIAKDWAVQVPLDDGCSLSGYGVHVSDDSVIWDAALK